MVSLLGILPSEVVMSVEAEDESTSSVRKLFSNPPLAIQKFAIIQQFSAFTQFICRCFNMCTRNRLSRDKTSANKINQFYKTI